MVQAPIKLLFPKNFNPADSGKNLSMLGNNFCVQTLYNSTEYMRCKSTEQFITHALAGLGDIVIPGIFLALLLRFDALHKTRT